jgi:hypothetical protein
MAKSAAVVSALSSGNGNTLMNFDLRLGNTSQLTAVFLNQNGTYGSLADADDDYPFFMDYPGETGLIATQVKNGGCNYNLEGNLQPQPQALNVPPGTVPQLTTDRKMDVRDSSSGKDFTFEGAGLITEGNVAANAGYFPIGFTDAGGQCSTGNYSNGAVENSSGSTPLGSDEVSYATALGLDDHASAGGMSQLWDIRAEDVLAGNPVHALIMNGGCDTNGANNILYPAYGNDFGGYCNNSSNNIDYGGHIVVDRQPAANLRGTDGCDIFSWFVLDTGYLYGFYMNDIGGVVQHPYLGLHMDSDISDTYSGNPYPPSGASPLTQVLTDMHNEWPEAYPSPSQNTRIGWGIPVTACGFTWNDFKYVIPPNKANYLGSP